MLFDLTRVLVMVESLQRLLHHLELFLRFLNCLLAPLQRDIIVRLVSRACLVFPRAVVLDLLAGVLHLCQAQRRGRAFQEVAQRGELIKISLIAATQLVDVVKCMIWKW